MQERLTPQYGSSMECFKYARHKIQNAPLKRSYLLA
jgi:hypothetical protein